MSRFTKIDLSKLPQPDFTENLTIEDIIRGLKEKLLELHPFAAEALQYESDPLNKLIEVFAYREKIMRTYINHLSKSVMLAYATGADLENLAAIFGVARRTVTPANKDSIPPTAAVWEDDETLRNRVHLSLEGHTTAGSAGAYMYHSLAADADVKNANISTPSAGTVDVVILSNSDSGVPSAALLQTVTDALNADQVRPLTDLVNVLPAQINNYQIDVTLTPFEGAGGELILTEATLRINEFVKEAHKLGQDIYLSAIHAALHVIGVERVEIAQPTADIINPKTHAGFCTNIIIRGL